MVEWWRSLWTSPEVLSRIFYGAKWATVVLGLLAATAIAISIIVSYRRDRLLAEEQARIAAISEKRLAQQESKISEIQTKQAPRMISAEQRQTIISALGGYGGQPILILELEDHEAKQYARQIADTLRAAGWTVRIRGMGVILHPVHGVVCILPDTGQPSEAAHALITAFHGNGIGLSVSRRGDIAKGLRIVLKALGETVGDITILVGLKPTEPSTATGN